MVVRGVRLLYVPGAVVNEQRKGIGVVEHQGGQEWRTDYHLSIGCVITT
jgi:hypothetical protein